MENNSWIFPNGGGGQAEGYEDAGVNIFREDVIGSLAREIIQNSYDAVYDNSLPVKVSFKLNEINSEDFPDIAGFRRTLERCLTYSREIENEAAKAFYKNALAIVNKEKMNLLVIGDYNTSGITGSERSKGGNWYSLIESIGSSNKTGSAGGSYGIGKSAPFACSSLRTVLYSTYDQKEIKAFKGVARLSTHELENEVKTRSTGFFGRLQENGNIATIFDNKIPSAFKRDLKGTDVTVVGFPEIDNWKEKLIKVVLSDFYYPIMKKRLVVEVEDTIIQKDTLNQLMNSHMKSGASDELITYYGYLALKQVEGSYFEEKEILYKNKNYGNVEIYLYPNQKAPKRICMTRENGMKIYYRNSQKLLAFTGLLVAKGDELNRVLRNMEPASHDKWQPNIIQNDTEKKKEAQGVKLNLEKALNEAIDNLADFTVGEETDLAGMSDFLPETSDQSDEKQNIEIEKRSPINFIFNSSIEESSLDNDLTNQIAAGVEGGVNSGSKSNGKINDITDRKKRETKRKKRVIKKGPEQGRKRTPTDLEISERIFGLPGKPGSYRIIIYSNRKATINLTFSFVADQISERVNIKSISNNIDIPKQTALHKGEVNKVRLNSQNNTIFDIELDKSIKSLIRLDKEEIK